jgi:hypothetical protein
VTLFQVREVAQKLMNTPAVTLRTRVSALNGSRAGRTAAWGVCWQISEEGGAMVNRSAAVIVLVITGLFIGASAAAAAEIEVCEHRNYGGRCVTFLHGVNDLREWGLSNAISSFRIRSGIWRLCSGPNLQGACQDFAHSVPDLAGTRLQDAVSSLRPVRSGAAGGNTAIVVYTAPNYRGRSWVFSDDISDLRRLGLNDQISSVRVLGGLWVICTDINYVGCRSVREDIPDLSVIGWGSRISSIREGQNWWNASGGPRGYGGGYEGGGRPGYEGGERQGYGGGQGRGGREGQVPTLTLFSDPDFRGRSYSTQREVRNLADVGFNDMASSIRITGGRWQVCTDKNFRGQCLVVTRDTNQLATNFFRQISSIRPY